MELDELKKSWNILDQQLQKEPIASDKQLKELIANFQANTNRSMRQIIDLQRFSIGAGVLALIAILIVGLSLPALFSNEQLQRKVVAFLIFITISILIGVGWDWKTYRWSKNTRIDEMSVAEVSRRMTIFRQWTKYEVIAISVWIVLFNILNYWAMEYYLMSGIAQMLLISAFAIFDTLIIYLLYKRVIYKHLDNINKNIEELKDICTE